MTDQIDRLFERFRQGGESEALGRVFDATAPRLLQLAIHLVGDIGAAEDLVQATFVTAIERASTFDASRSLDAWLAGILANHARDLKKAARREIDVASLAERVESTPLEHALQTEWSSALAQALDGVPEPYRVILILRLQHGMTPTEIAHALQRSPGAVRVQLHRGREMLRKLLPAGFLASAVFIAEPSRGLGQVKAKIIAEAGLAKSSAGSVGIVGGLFMGTKLLVGVAALVLAALAIFLMRRHSPEASPVTSATGPQPATLESITRTNDKMVPIEAPAGAVRVDASVSQAPSDVATVKLHGRVVDSDSDVGIPDAEVTLFAAHTQPLSDVRHHWHDRLEVSEDGSVEAVAWPRFGAPLSDAARLDAENVVVYEPPGGEDRPIARTTTGASGEFEIRVPESLGFLVCSASGYATRQRALSPADVNTTRANDVSIKVALRAPRPLAGYVVDEGLKRLERRVRIAFIGHVNKPTPTRQGDTGHVEAELQMDQWDVETKSDGGFECALPASMVYAQSLEPDLGVVKQGYPRDGGTRWVHEVWPEPGRLNEPLVIVMKPIGSILVRDRDTHAPIEDINLQCTSTSHGQVLRYGHFFAPQGRLRVAPEGAVQENKPQKENEVRPCQCTVWSEGYAPVTRTLESSIAGHVTEFDLERGEAPAVSGRIHDGERAVDKARITLSLLWWSGTWVPPNGMPIATATSDIDGRFSIAAPAGRYVLTIVSGGDEESRVVELPLAAPIDVDLSVDTAILASVHDSSGVACAGHPVALSGPDGRMVRVKTDTNGLARFPRLPAGAFRVQVMSSATPGPFRAAQEVSIDLRKGEEKRVDLVIGGGTPRFARIVVDGIDSYAGWKAGKGHGRETTWADVDTNGRIPVDIRWMTYLRITAPMGREWGARLPKDAPDGYEVRLSLDGLGYEGVVTSQATGEPLRGMRVIASPWNAPEGTGIVTTVVTDEEGRFRITGLEDDAYSMRFEDVPFTYERQDKYVQPTGRPSTPPTHLAIALPKKTGAGPDSYGGHGYEGFEEMTVTGAIRKASASTQGFVGYIGSVIARPGYNLRLYTEFVVGPSGTYEARVPIPSGFVASLRNSTTGESFPEILWDAGGASDREVHDIDLP